MAWLGVELDEFLYIDSLNLNQQELPKYMQRMKNFQITDDDEDNNNEEDEDLKKRNFIIESTWFWNRFHNYLI